MRLLAALAVLCSVSAHAEDMLGEPVPVQRSRVFPAAPLTKARELERDKAQCHGKAEAIKNVMAQHDPRAPITYSKDFCRCMVEERGHKSCSTS